MGRGGYAEILGYRRRPVWPRVLLGTVVILGVGGTGYLAGRSTLTALRPASPVALRVPVGSSGWPGSARLENGAPVAYPDTELGAVQAATNDDALEQGDLLTDPAAYRAAYATVVAPAWRAGGADHAEQALTDAAYLTAAAQRGKPVTLRPVAFTYHVNAFTAAAADITIWGGVAFGVDGDIPATLGTRAARYSMVWLGDWKLAGRGPDEPGPGMIASVAKPQSATLPAELGVYKGYHDVP